MQPLDKYIDNLGVAILLVGPAGSGKTVTGLRLFKKTYAFIADLNFKSGKDYLTKINEIGNVVGFDTATPDENGKPVTPMLRYDRMLKCIGDAHKDPNVDCVFIDSATFIEDIIKAKICSAANETAIKLEGYGQWGQLLMTWKSIIMQCRQSGKKLIMAAHENKEKDASDNIYKYGISVDGQIAAKFPALFSDVWRTEVVEEGPKHVRKVRCLGNVRHEFLKNTYGFDAVLLQDDLVKKVREVTK